MAKLSAELAVRSSRPPSPTRATRKPTSSCLGTGCTRRERLFQRPSLRRAESPLSFKPRKLYLWIRCTMTPIKALLGSCVAHFVDVLRCLRSPMTRSADGTAMTTFHPQHAMSTSRRASTRRASAPMKPNMAAHGGPVGRARRSSLRVLQNHTVLTPAFTNSCGTVAYSGLLLQRLPTTMSPYRCLPHIV